MNAPAVRIAQKSTPTLIADALRDDIQAGRLAAGTALHQTALAERFGVSRIPVREALRQLETEGAIRYVPSRGAIVTTYGADEIRERFEMRAELEPLALRLALPHLTPATLRAAERELDAMREETDPARWGKHHAAFHHLLYEPAKRPHLLAIIESLYISVAVSLTPATLPDHTRAHDAEHRALLDACAHGDADAAAAAMRAHLAGTLERTLAARGLL
ncbi:MAG: GntR family transcriptional regulator [Candidatus Eremiobacteraeota bacterium]|nr:GntR family transcriptional regulator [Candidatus Eremiobacteraeota bacterium]